MNIYSDSSDTNGLHYILTFYLLTYTVTFMDYMDIYSDSRDTKWLDYILTFYLHTL